MNPGHRFTLLCMSAAALACSAEEAGSGPVAAEASTASLQGDATAVLSGSGHHSRIVGGVEHLTTFSFSAIRHADGSASGQYQYDFRANGFAIHGPVTCVSRSGNQVWVGGIVDRVVTDVPDFEALQGLEMWWRSIDNGEGSNATPDVTTGVGFGFPGSAITAESWCRDQPIALVARVVENGNIQVR